MKQETLWEGKRGCNSERPGKFLRRQLYRALTSTRTPFVFYPSHFLSPEHPPVGEARTRNWYVSETEDQNNLPGDRVTHVFSRPF